MGTRAVATAAATPTTRRGRKTTQEHVPSKAPAAIVVLPQPAPTPVTVTVVTRRKRKVQAADLEVDHNDDSARRTRRKLNPSQAPSPVLPTAKPVQTRATARKTGTKRKAVTIDPVPVPVPVVEAPPPSPRATSEDSVTSDASELFSDSAEQTVDSAATTPEKDLFTKSSGSTPSPPLAVTSLPELDAVLQKVFSPEPVAQPASAVEVDSSVPVAGPVDDSSAPIASTSALPVELATTIPEDLSSTQIDTPTTSEPVVSSDPLDTATSIPSAPAPEGELTAAAALQLARDELFGQLGADRRPDSSARRTGRDAEWLADSRLCVYCSFSPLFVRSSSFTVLGKRAYRSTLPRLVVPHVRVIVWRLYVRSWRSSRNVAFVASPRSGTRTLSYSVVRTIHSCFISRKT